MILAVEPAKALLVASREYLENVRTRGFWFSILMMPFVLALVSSAPVLFSDAESAARYAVLDRSGWVADAVAARIMHDDITLLVAELARRPANDRPKALVGLGSIDVTDKGVGLVNETIRMLTEIDATGQALDVASTPAERIARWWSTDPDAVSRFTPDVSLSRYRYVATPDLDKTALNHLLATDALLGYFVIPDDPVANGGEAAYVTRKLTNLDVQRWYAAQVTDVVRDRRIRQENIAPATADWIQAPIEFVSMRLSDGGVETTAALSDTLGQWAPVAFVYLLWISIFSITQMLLTNTVEEKSNKLVEVLLSSVAPVDLMAGKILGIAATGITIVIAWLGLFIAAVLWLPGLLGAAVTVNLSGLINSPTYLASFFVYFFLGYLFYAALLCGIGSLASNLKEAQTLMMPIQLLLIVPLLVMVPIGRDPNGLLAQVMSWLPPFTPFVMMNRAAFPPSLITYFGTTLLMLISIYAALKIAARVFETGILMTGKPPRFRHLLNLLRGKHRDAP